MVCLKYKYKHKQYLIIDDAIHSFFVLFYDTLNTK